MLPALRHSTEPRAVSCALRHMRFLAGLERQTRQPADVLERILRHSRHPEDVAENISVVEIDPRIRRIRCRQPALACNTLRTLRNLSPPAKTYRVRDAPGPARLRLLNRAAPFARKGVRIAVDEADPSPVGCLATRMGRPRGVGEALARSSQVAAGERASKLSDYLATTTSSMSLHQNIKHPTSQSFWLVR
ncbi:hypothetical protein MYCTH_2122366 [Thermothelomyces thermophilus ATCC 42464]|uniref:Uncharacterized protein n=1 Tax=Thermothelomyces thermophilus (strain ATCC 42464 / BCRC 31852 / DSM 1799) TaxID=573729 RepID=G2Q346_THET4|nr:uncharacterized protein MYCTH_2122366 [Thermothelomyces thermophilus ATCC 42464]AEO53509.1 hypothetical protein MYCTH_2122366 [Thermothelomyces thermophilus ATCC 42464]